MKIKKLIAALLSVLLCVTMLSDMMAVFAEELLPEAAVFAEETAETVPEETGPAEEKAAPEEVPEAETPEEPEMPEGPEAEPAPDPETKEPAPAEEETPEAPAAKGPAAEAPRAVGPFDPSAYDHDLDAHVISVTVEPQAYLEGDTVTKTVTVGEGDDAYQVDFENYYQCEQPWITVQTDNGSEFFGTAQGVQAQILSAYGLPSDLKVWDFSVDQQYGDPWQTGTHDGCLYFAGEIYTYPVEIIPNPVLSVEINDVYRTPDMAFEVTELYMNNGQTEYGTYDKYDIEPWVTVRTAEGSYEGLVRNVDQTLADRYYLTRRYPTQLGSNQSPVNPWVSGNVYSAHFNFWGSRYDYSVSIVDSLITDASADAPVFIYDLLESETVTETTDEGEVTWNRLIADCVPESVTVWTADGSRFSGEPEAVRWEIINKFGLNDQVVEFDYGTDQSYENQWTVGTHHAWFSLMGQTFAYDVTLIDNPVLSATAGDLQFSTADVGMSPRLGPTLTSLV